MNTLIGISDTIVAFKRSVVQSVTLISKGTATQ